MKAIVAFRGDDVSDEPIGVCPFCHAFEKRNVQIEDYVERPMLWCDGCGARSVLDLPLEFEVAALDSDPVVETLGACEDLKRLDPDAHPRDHPAHREEVKLDAYRFFRVPLLWIRRAVCAGLDRYRTTRALSQPELRRFVASNYDGSIQRELGLEKRKKRLRDPHEVDLALGIECQSYNAEKPAVPYPPHFALDHDGIYAYLECSKGPDAAECFRVMYWGD